MLKNQTKILYVIPARGGSKGIPRKNIRLLAGKPLIWYSIDVARSLGHDSDICISTDDDTILQVAEDYGLKVPFKRPAELASDAAGMNEVLVSAVEHFRKLGKKYSTLVLLQPTSPFRTVQHVQDAIKLMRPDLDMVVSVRVSKSNPYYSIFEENGSGFLQLSKESNYVRRQDCPPVYEYNGSIYVINIDSLIEKGMSKFRRIVKYVMDDVHSLDIDDILDWQLAEFYIERGII
jgi:N-acylneuraminate cytidylyltransferase